MKISIIVAMGPKREIGYQNQLPWHISWDLKNFKNITTGHHILMGRKTFESIGKPLPNRSSIILSQNQQFALPEHCFLVSKLSEGIDLAHHRKESELFIIGGAQIYALALPLAHTLYRTKVEYQGQADTFFPSFDENAWQIKHSEQHEGFQFEILDRR